MWSFLATILSALIGLFTKPKTDNPVTTANRMTAQSAQIGRETAAQTEKDISDANDQNRVDLDRIAHSDSVRDRLDALQALNDRANQAGPGK